MKKIYLALLLAPLAFASCGGGNGTQPAKFNITGDDWGFSMGEPGELGGYGGGPASFKQADNGDYTGKLRVNGGYIPVKGNVYKNTLGFDKDGNDEGGEPLIDNDGFQCKGKWAATGYKGTCTMNADGEVSQLTLTIAHLLKP